MNSVKKEDVISVATLGRGTERSTDALRSPLGTPSEVKCLNGHGFEHLSPLDSVVLPTTDLSGFTLHSHWLKLCGILFQETRFRLAVAFFLAPL